MTYKALGLIIRWAVSHALSTFEPITGEPTIVNHVDIPYHQQGCHQLTSNVVSRDIPQNVPYHADYCEPEKHLKITNIDVSDMFANRS